MHPHGTSNLDGDPGLPDRLCAVGAVPSTAVNSMDCPLRFEDRIGYMYGERLILIFSENLLVEADAWETDPNMDFWHEVSNNSGRDSLRQVFSGQSNRVVISSVSVRDHTSATQTEPIGQIWECRVEQVRSRNFHNIRGDSPRTHHISRSDCPGFPLIF